MEKDKVPVPLFLCEKNKFEVNRIRDMFLSKTLHLSVIYRVITLKLNRQQIITILARRKDLLRRFSVKNIYLFGSSSRNKATSTSDVDLLVEFDQNARVGLFQFCQLRRELSQVLKCDVDLVTPDGLHKELKADILKEAVHAA
jgi:predicted nucleotidyltransferase